MAEIKMDSFYEFIEFYRDFEFKIGSFQQMVSANIDYEDMLNELLDEKYWHADYEGGIINHFRREIKINLMLKYIEKKDYLEEIYYYGIFKLLPTYIGQKPLYEPFSESDSSDVRWNILIQKVKPVYYHNLQTLESFAYEIYQIADGKGVFLYAPHITLKKIPELRLNEETHNYLKFIDKNEVDKVNARYLDSPAPYILKIDSEGLKDLKDKSICDWPFVENDVVEKESDSDNLIYNDFDLTHTHRTIIFTHNFRVEAGSAEPLNTRGDWKKHGNRNGVSGNNRANQWYTTNPKNKKTYDPPRTEEIEIIFQSLKNEPHALEIAKQGILGLLKEYPERLEQAKEVIYKY